MVQLPENPQSWAGKKGVDPTPITPACSATRCCAPTRTAEYFNALLDEMLAFRVPMRDCTPNRARRL